MKLSASEKFVIGALIGGAAIYAFHSNYAFAYNLTPSLPYKAFFIKKGAPVGRGDLVAFKWRGGLGYDRGSLIIKKVAAVGGDIVIKQGREFLVNGDVVAKALERTRTGQPVQAAAGGEVARGQYFVVATNPISLDSRYAKFGNVNQSEVIGRAYPIW